MATSADGASANERLIAAARQDCEELLLEIFDQGNFDINHKDGLGNTALHNAVLYSSVDVLEHILSHEECDVDPINRLQGATPLHLAVVINDEETRRYFVENLLEAGADTSIRDKNGDLAIDLLPLKETEIRALIRKSQAQSSVSRADIVDEDDEEFRSGSGSEEG